MELIEAITGRRSARAYAEELVSFDTVKEVMETAANAPSACNRRNWRCILIQQRASLDWLKSQGGSSVLNGCAQALLVCYEADTENREWDDNIQSAASFIAYFQLIAHERGIGSCWICHLPPKKEVMDYFSIPSEYTPVAVVTFGYYRTGSSLSPRKETSKKILSLEKWDFDDLSSDVSEAVSLARKTLRKIYYSLPFRSLLRPFAERFEKKFDE